ncbi:TrkH family potassium uptake protein [Deinococcus sp. KNUC1210]|uniref:TrkH family potassium uptake protein n=1 Tax=Deinococcus sp. KNUC1210 TaxID=2917691 RepID=UPI001EF027E6|nr:TrkH family potassium uptake protein [Deinococcus sp. KNUC1210]ULH15287.1 TrkH family potassium uptake protein [Deinococcus sp. KNUC1210]
MTRPLKRPLLSHFSPPQLIALSFALAIAVGSGLLLLPFAQQDGQRLDVLTAVFTATTALCVTGLKLIDPARTLSVPGQLVMLLLIQLGGLGLITFGTVFALALRRRVKFSERLRLAQQVSAFDVGGVLGLIRKIFVYTLIIEGLGTLLLALRFVPQFGWGQGLYYSLVHAVSAFNNAGFSLFGNSLQAYRADPLVCLTMCALVILGGLGFLVQVNVVAHLLRRRSERLLVHSRLVLTTTLLLLVAGTLLIAAFEWNNPLTLGPLTLGEKLLTSFVSSVMPRTGGFSTLNTELLRPATLFLTIFLMFVGASPGGAGGGIKTSTLAVIAGSAWSMVRGQGEMVAFHRRIEESTVLRAMTVGLLASAVVGVMLLLMLAFNTTPRLDFSHLAFETVSAFSTVGLSMNTTPDTNTAQRVILIVLMYLGRIGPLTFALALGQRVKRRDVSYPPERDILIG